MSGEDSSIGAAAAPPAAAIRNNSPGYVLALLAAVSFFNNLDRMVLPILVEPIKLELNLSDSQMGLMSGIAFALFYATLGLPLARVADRYFRVRLIAVCLILWSAMTAVTGMARNFTELFLARMGVGVGEAGCAPASHSILGDLFPAERRPFAISIFQAGGTLGQSAGLALAGVIAEIYGWRTALLVVGLAGIPLALLMLFTVREPPRAPRHAEAAGESTWTTLKALLARPPLVHLVIGVAIATFTTMGMVQWLPAFFIRSHGLNLAEVGVLNATAGVIAAVFGTIFGGYALTRLGKKDARWELWWPMMVFAIFPFFMAPSFLVDDWRIMIGLQVAGFFFSASAGGVAFAALQSYVEPHRRATAVATLLFLSSLLGLGLGPVLVGVISDLLALSFGQESLRYALLATLCLPFWASTHFWLAARDSKRWRLG
jgi:predicted MFS family arabinose efflux permease